MQKVTKQRKKVNTAINCIAFFALGSYTIACIYLFYMQAIQKIVDIEAGSHLFESDLPYHIKMAVIDGWYYSLTGLLYKLFYILPGSTYLVALFLGLIAGFTVYLTYRILNKIWITFPKYVAIFFAIALNVMMAAHLDFGHTAWYIGYESGNLWHNSTYLVMRLFACLTIIWYLRCKGKYAKKLPLFDGIIYSFLLILTTSVKPSFILVFLPTMAILLLIDLIKGVSFKRIALFAITVLPSLALLLIQQVILFRGTSESGITIDPWYTLSLHANHPKVTLILSIAFPLLVLVFSVRKLWKDSLYLGTWIMWGIGFLQILLITETGARSNDGNFIWGYAFCIFVLNIFSLLVYIGQLKKKEDCLGPNWLQKIYFFVAGFLFLYQTFCGIQFFIWMLQGKSYWI